MMHKNLVEQLIIQGSTTLRGTVHLSGAKNASLPIIAATLLSEKPSKLYHIPRLLDTTAMLEALCSLNTGLCLHEDLAVTLDPSNCQSDSLSKSVATKLRGSFLLLGPLLARFGKAQIPLPGGCKIGARPVDVHLHGLKKMGAQIELQSGTVFAHTQKKLQGADITLEVASVTGTENLMMAACLAQGTTILRNAACEPEITDLAVFLNAMGGKVSGAGTNTITIEGVDQLTGCEHHIIYDRVEAGTYLIGAALTQGDITLHNIDHTHLGDVINKLRQAGAEIQCEANRVHLKMTQKPQAVSIETAVYPGFPTDLQAQWLTLNCVAEGSATIQENIFEHRFMHAVQLQKMGARIHIEGNQVITQGSDTLIGCDILASDIRASAGLILAGLVAKGTTKLANLHHVDRGYVHLEENLCNLGADVQRFFEAHQSVQT
jgi:UDP-N-acetylglucosamine 1-carboxyvinyltransferase